MPLHFEDVVVGKVYRTASTVMTGEDIVRYATEWDPQTFHIDREAAKETFFGGLVASGLHTFSQTFRLYHDLGLFHGTAVAGVGVEGMRWLRPVREGTSVHVTATPVAAVPTRRPEHGRVTIRLQMLDEAEVCLFTCDLTILLLTRAGAAG